MSLLYCRAQQPPSTAKPDATQDWLAGIDKLRIMPSHTICFVRLGGKSHRPGDCMLHESWHVSDDFFRDLHCGNSICRDAKGFLSVDSGYYSHSHNNSSRQISKYATLEQWQGSRMIVCHVHKTVSIRVTNAGSPKATSSSWRRLLRSIQWRYGVNEGKWWYAICNNLAPIPCVFESSVRQYIRYPRSGDKVYGQEYEHGLQ